MARTPGDGLHGQAAGGLEGPLPARLGPRGGPQGGVAVLLPPGVELVSSRVLVPGCAIEVVARHGGGGTDGWVATVRSVYLPPDSRREVLHDLRANLGARCAGGQDGRPSISAVGGDLNMQLAAPRDAAEEADATLAWAIFSEQGLPPGLL